MNTYIKLVKRNQSLFYRHKGNILFSTLSVLILLVLHFLLFRTMFTEQWQEVANMFNLTLDSDELLWLIDTLMFAAIIPIASISISLVSLGVVVSDRENKSLNDFLVTPLQRNALFISYLMSSFIIGFTILSVFVIFYQAYFFIVYGFGFSLLQVAYILLIVVGSLIFANSFVLLIIIFAGTQQSLGSIGTILGTSIGFITGAYVPLNQFGENIANVCNMLPFAQLTVLSKKVFLMNLEDNTNLPIELVTGDIGKSFGIELWIFDNLLTIPQILMILAAFIVLFIAILVRRYAKLKVEE